MWKLACRNVFRHKIRTALTLAAIMLGVGGLIVSGGFVEDTLIQLREATIHSQLGHLQVYKAGYAKFGRSEPFRYMIEDPEKTIDEIRGLPHVIDIMPRVSFSGLLSNGRSTFGVTGEGIDPAKEQKFSNAITILSGRPLAAGDRYGILLGQGVANTLKLEPGDRATLLLNTAGGALNSLDFEVTGIFQTISKTYDDRAVRLSLDGVQELLGSAGVHKLVFALDQTAATETVAQELSRRLAASEFEIRRWHELADFYQKAVDLYRRYFAVLRLIILGLLLLGVANSINISIHQRLGEFGTLMALGNRRNHIFGLIMTEKIILGLLGSAGGVIFGTVAALLISLVGIPMPPMPNTTTGYVAHVRIVPLELGLGFLIGLLATALAGLLPAWRAAQLKPVDALAHN